MADWSQLKVVDLKAELKKRGLPYAGLKAELVARLDAADEEATQQEGDNAPEEQSQPEAVEADNVEAEQPALVSDRGQSPEPANASPRTAVNEPLERTASPPPQEPAQKPTTEEPAIEKPTSEEPVNQEPANQEPTVEEPAVEEPAVDKTAVEKPAAEELVAEEPAEQEPPAQEPATQEPATADASIEPTPEAQKRKRRSDSPLPTEEDIAQKRTRVDVPSTDETKDADVHMTSVSHEEQPSTGVDVQNIEMERSVAPAQHVPTAALYISNLMRPLRPDDLKNHLTGLAATHGSNAGMDTITKFYLDQIRTHAFVAFDSAATALRVRTALHDTVWPNESNRKALAVDFIPLERVDEWIEMEEAGGRRSSIRWQVIYTPGASNETVEAALVESTLASRARPAEPPAAAQPPPPRMGPGSANAMPIGPRAQRGRDQYREDEDEGDRARGRDLDDERNRQWDSDMMRPPPTGPRDRRQGPRSAAAAASTLDRVVETTKSRPHITYQPVVESMANRRLDNISVYSNEDTSSHFNSNRYSFEGGDNFVDRGREIFEGIRPPHREAERRGGRGSRPPRRGSPFRSRGDRYVPSSQGRRSGPSAWH